MRIFREAGYFFSVLMMIGALFGMANGQDQIPNADELNIILLYCYQHADRANPVQDLVDKGLVSSEFAGKTCPSVKQQHDKEKTALQDMHLRYQDCKADQTKTFDECENIWRGPYNECIAEMAELTKTLDDCMNIYEKATGN